MLTRDKDKLAVSKLLVMGSYLAAFLAIVGALGTDIYLASTQWMLVALILVAWGIYGLIEAQFKLK